MGKGAFGSVYKAFNWGTGEAVAVKQIKLADLPKSELRMIEVTLPLTISKKYLHQPADYRWYCFLPLHSLV